MTFHITTSLSRELPKTFARDCRNWNSACCSGGIDGVMRPSIPILVSPFGTFGWTICSRYIYWTRCKKALILLADIERIVSTNSARVVLASIWGKGCAAFLFIETLDHRVSFKFATRWSSPIALCAQWHQRSNCKWNIGRTRTRFFASTDSPWTFYMGVWMVGDTSRLERWEARCCEPK